jgi:Zn-dependent protease
VASFAVINLLTAVSNLIPIRGFDGHRILIGLLSGRLSQDGLDRVSRGLTLSISAAVALLSLFFMMKIGEGYWIFVVFFVVMCREIMAAHKSAKNENSRAFERI